MRNLKIPFIWGPVGGAEVTPRGFAVDFRLVGRVKELAKELVLKLSFLDPYVRKTAKTCQLAFATTEQSSESLRRRGVEGVLVMGESGLSQEEVDLLKSYAPHAGDRLRFLCMGRLIHWKGFQLAINGFAQAALREAELWICGEGPYRKKLEELCRKYGVAERVVFFGQLDRPACLEKLRDSHVLVHPSLRDSGGWVCLEAMASKHPVICLDYGGPGYQLTDECGVKISVNHYARTVQDIARAMQRLAEDSTLRERMGTAGLQRIQEHFLWVKKAAFYSDLYRKMLAGDGATRAIDSSKDGLCGDAPRS